MSIGPVGGSNPINPSDDSSPLPQKSLQQVIDDVKTWEATIPQSSDFNHVRLDLAQNTIDPLLSNSQSVEELQENFTYPMQYYPHGDIYYQFPGLTQDQADGLYQALGLGQAPKQTPVDAKLTELHHTLISSTSEGTQACAAIESYVQQNIPPDTPLDSCLSQIQNWTQQNIFSGQGWVGVYSKMSPEDIQMIKTFTSAMVSTANVSLGPTASERATLNNNIVALQGPINGSNLADLSGKLNEMISTVNKYSDYYGYSIDDQGNVQGIPNSLNSDQGVKEAAQMLNQFKSMQVQYENYSSDGSAYVNLCDPETEKPMTLFDVIKNGPDKSYCFMTSIANGDPYANPPAASIEESLRGSWEQMKWQSWGSGSTTSFKQTSAQMRGAPQGDEFMTLTKLLQPNVVNDLLNAPGSDVSAPNQAFLGAYQANGWTMVGISKMSGQNFTMMGMGRASDIFSSCHITSPANTLTAPWSVATNSPAATATLQDLKTLSAVPPDLPACATAWSELQQFSSRYASYAIDADGHVSDDSDLAQLAQSNGLDFNVIVDNLKGHPVATKNPGDSSTPLPILNAAGQPATAFDLISDPTGTFRFKVTFDNGRVFNVPSGGAAPSVKDPTFRQGWLNANNWAYSAWSNDSLYRPFTWQGWSVTGSQQTYGESSFWCQGDAQGRDILASAIVQ